MNISEILNTLKYTLLIDYENSSSATSKELSLKEIFTDALILSKEHFVSYDSFGSKPFDENGQPNNNKVIQWYSRDFEYIVSRILYTNIVLDSFCDITREIKKNELLEHSSKYMAYNPFLGPYSYSITKFPSPNDDEFMNDNISKVRDKIRNIKNSSILELFDSKLLEYSKWFLNGNKTSPMALFDCDIISDIHCQSSIAKHYYKIINTPPVPDRDRTKSNSIHYSLGMITKQIFKIHNDNHKNLKENLNSSDHNLLVDSLIRVHKFSKYFHTNFLEILYRLIYNLKSKGFVLNNFNTAICRIGSSLPLSFGADYLLYSFPMEFWGSSLLYSRQNSFNTETLPEMYTQQEWANCYLKYISMLTYETFPVLKASFIACLYANTKALNPKDDVESLLNKMSNKIYNGFNEIVPFTLVDYSHVANNPKCSYSLYPFYLYTCNEDLGLAFKNLDNRLYGKEKDDDEEIPPPQYNYTVDDSNIKKIIEEALPDSYVHYALNYWYNPKNFELIFSPCELSLRSFSGLRDKSTAEYADFINMQHKVMTQI